MSNAVWTKLDNKNSLMSKGTQYRNMQQWSRPCALCKKDFVAYTPGNAPSDKPPTVTTCDDHRGAPSAITAGWLAWDGENIVPGRKMKCDGVSTMAPHDREDLERLQNWEAMFYEVLKQVQTKLPDTTMTNLGERVAILIKAADDVYAAYQALRVQHELAPAMAAQATQNKMPWEQK